MDATTTAQLVANTFSAMGGTIVTYILPVALLLFGGITLYFFAKRFIKGHLHK